MNLKELYHKSYQSDKEGIHFSTYNGKKIRNPSFGNNPLEYSYYTILITDLGIQDKNKTEKKKKQKTLKTILEIAGRHKE